ncbi:MAG: hypothetical protein ABII79_11370 [bacterium]
MDYAPKDSPDHVRVVQILGNTLKGINHKEGTIKSADPDFDEAFKCLSQNLEQALNLFETQNLEDFSNRQRFASQLADPYNCFYSIGDWSIALEQFLEFQRTNKESLLQTGYPEMDFDVSPWLDCQLGCLYFVRKRHQGKDGVFWLRSTGQERVADGTICEYPDADYLKFLKPEETDRLDSPVLRKEVYAFKCEVVKRLLSQVQVATPRGIGQEAALTVAQVCLEKSKTVLRSDDTHFLLTVDEKYGLFYDSDHLPSHRNTEKFLRPGGLTDLLTVIGRVTGEMALRSITDLRIRLRPWKAEDPRVGIEFDLKDFYRDYSSGSPEWFDRLFFAWEMSKQGLDEYLNVFQQRAIQVLRAGSGSTVLTEKSVINIKGSVSGKSPKPALELNKMTREVWIDGKKVTLTEGKYRRFDALYFLLTELKNSDKPVESHRIVSKAGAKKTYRVYDLFKKTPIQPLLRNEGWGLYSLKINLSKSRTT